MMRYGGFILAALLLLAFAVPAGAQVGTPEDAGRGGMHEEMGKPEGGAQHMQAGQRHAGVAPGVACDKQCVLGVQRKLKDRGLYLGSLDGIAGPQTRRAVRLFQGEQNIQATGSIDYEVLSRLDVPPSTGRGAAAPAGPRLPGVQPPSGGGAAKGGASQMGGAGSAPGGM